MFTERLKGFHYFVHSTHYGNVVIVTDSLCQKKRSPEKCTEIWNGKRRSLRGPIFPTMPCILINGQQEAACNEMAKLLTAEDI